LLALVFRTFAAIAESRFARLLTRCPVNSVPRLTSRAAPLPKSTPPEKKLLPVKCVTAASRVVPMVTPPTLSAAAAAGADAADTAADAAHGRRRRHHRTTHCAADAAADADPRAADAQRDAAAFRPRRAGVHSAVVKHSAVSPARIHGTEFRIGFMI
jgi:hypothetical protein